MLEAVKKLERWHGQLYWRDYPQPERQDSVAEHSWRMCMMVILIEPQLSKKLDLTKALKMALIHDVPEIIAGDASPLGTDGTGMDSHAFNEKIAAERHREERGAAETIFNKLPKEQADEYLDLWQEFEDQSSFEAKVVKSIDKMEAKIQMLEYTNAHLFPKHFEFNVTYGVEDAANTDPAIHELMTFIVNKIKKNYKEFSKKI